MADIPLAADDKGNVVGFDGQRWRPPDDIAVNDKGQKAYRFGETWQVEPGAEPPTTLMRNVAPASSESDELGNTAMITAAGAAKGLRLGLDPRGPALLGMSLFPPLRDAMRAVGADKAIAGAREADPINYARQIPGVGQFIPSPAVAETYSDPQKTATALGAEMTPRRKGLATGAEIFGASVPMMVNPSMAGWAAVAALGGALGEQVGGETGKAVGAMLPAVMAPAAGLARAGMKMGREMTAPFTEKGLQGMADRALLEASGATPQKLAASLKQAPLPGQPATLGQRTGNRGLLDAEYALHGKTPLIEDSYRSTARLAGEEMASLAGTGERAASEGLRTALDQARAGAKAQASAKWGPVETAMEGLRVPRQDFAEIMAPHLRSLSRAEASAIPGDIRGNISSLMQTKAVINGQPITLKTFRMNEVTGLRSTLASAVREATVAGNDNRARILRGLMRRVDEYIDKVGASAFGDKYGEARAAWRSFKGAYDKDPQIGALFRKNADGTWKIPPSEVGDALKGMPVEAIERAAKLPGVKGRMRDYIAAAWRERATTANADARASGMPSFAAALKFRQENDAIFRAAFSKEDLARADKIIKALEAPTLPEFGQRRFGSPTYNKFAKGTLIEGIIGKWLGHIPGGGMLNQALGNFVFSRPIAQLEQKIAEALLSPDQTMARLLTMKATPGNARLLGRYLGPSAISAEGAARVLQDQ